MFRWIQLFLGALGLIALLRTAFFMWGMEAISVVNEYGLYFHVGVNLAKKQDLLFHVGGVLALCFYFFCAYLSMQKRLIVTTASCSVQAVWLCCSSLHIFLVLSWNPSNPATSMDIAIFALLLSLWFASNFLLLCFRKIRRFIATIDWAAQWNPQNNIRILTVFFALAALQLFLVLSPFTIGPIRLLNEYPDIPTVTTLYEADVNLLDKAYYDDRGLLGPARRYLPDRDHGKTPPINEEVCMVLAQTPGLSFFLSQEPNRNGPIVKGLNTENNCMTATTNKAVNIRILFCGFHCAAQSTVAMERRIFRKHSSRKLLANHINTSNTNIAMSVEVTGLPGRQQSTAIIIKLEKHNNIVWELRLISDTISRFFIDR